MDRALAASGLLVVAVDMTLAPEAPYPACVEDANYVVRWLKANAATWNGEATKLGVYGSSSGGRVAAAQQVGRQVLEHHALFHEALRLSFRITERIVFKRSHGELSNSLARPILGLAIARRRLPDRRAEADANTSEARVSAAEVRNDEEVRSGTTRGREPMA
jgi:acetyl esterase/lipase